VEQKEQTIFICGPSLISSRSCQTLLMLGRRGHTAPAAILDSGQKPLILHPAQAPWEQNKGDPCQHHESSQARLIMIPPLFLVVDHQSKRLLLLLSIHLHWKKKNSLKKSIFHSIPKWLTSIPAHSISILIFDK
jgi:hypothetical protein